MSRTTLSLARGLYTVVGGGALIMAITTLMSGASITDPVFPAAIALGLLLLAAAAWADSPSQLQSVAVWLGLVAVVIALVIIGSMALRTPSPDVLAPAGIPSALMVAAGARIAAARVTAGAFGRGAADSVA